MAKTSKALKVKKRAQRVLPVTTPADPIDWRGMEVRDKITGFKGNVSAITFMLSGCIQAHVQPPIGKDGKLELGWFLDLDRLEIIERGPTEATAPDSTGHIKLGVTATDLVTECTGTLTEKQVHINGCTTFILTMKGAAKDSRTIALDWKRLDLAGSKVIVPAPKPAIGGPKGGPMRQGSPL